MGEVKPLKYKELPGLSEIQLSEHHDVLYAGYVKKTDAIRKALQTVSKEGSNATYAEFRELKLEETFAVNGARLHEAYFDNMGVANHTAEGAIADFIKADFGSVEAWASEFSASGMAARGWVVLAFDLEDGKLHNYVCDMHNQGGVWNCIPLLVLDVYEHAYFIDYKTARKKYIDSFMANIDWAEVNARIEKSKLKDLKK